MPSNSKISEAYHPQDRERFQNSSRMHPAQSHQQSFHLHIEICTTWRSVAEVHMGRRAVCSGSLKKKSLELWPHVVHSYLGCHRIHVYILLHISVCGWVKTLFYHILPYSERNEHRSIPAIWSFICWPVALLAFLLDQNHHFNPKFAAKWSVVIYIYTHTCGSNNKNVLSFQPILAT